MESLRPKSEKVVPTSESVKIDISKDKENGWFVSYTNINGLVSTLPEISDYLRAKKSDIFGLVEMKLSDSEDVPVGEEQCSVWRRNRNQKKGGGVMVLTREDVIMEKVEKKRRYDRGVEVRVGNEKWKKKRLGSHINSTQDQGLEERRV